MMDPSVIPIAALIVALGALALNAWVARDATRRQDHVDLRERVARVEREAEDCVRERAQYIRENTELLRRLAGLDRKGGSKK